MKKLQSTLAALAVVTLLAACGGGDEGVVVEERDPTPTGLPASMTVSGATGAEVLFNGTYSTTDVRLNNVTKVNPPGDDPETCRFEFEGLQQNGSTRQMVGDVRYLPGTNALQQSFVAIEGVNFGLEGTAGATVNRGTGTGSGNVTYTNAVFTSVQGTGRTITLSGSVPMRDDRPEGC
jgi:hypothetical protein